MLTADKITKNYGKGKNCRNVLDGISFTAQKGECIGIIGSNGCGKSTLLNILAGVLKADGGSISFCGKPCTSYDFSDVIGYVPQENPLFERLSALDNLRFWYGGDVLGLKNDLENGLPAVFGISDYLKKRVCHLSGGMKKRLSIACALAKHQSVLILDEPCAALDIPGKEDIHAYLRDYAKNGGTVIITSHEEPEILMCSTVYLLKDGKFSDAANSKDSILKLIERINRQ